MLCKIVIISAAPWTEIICNRSFIRTVSGTAGPVHCAMCPKGWVLGNTRGNQGLVSRVMSRTDSLHWSRGHSLKINPWVNWLFQNFSLIDSYNVTIVPRFVGLLQVQTLDYCDFKNSHGRVWWRQMTRRGRRVKLRLSGISRSKVRSWSSFSLSLARSLKTL